MRYTVVMHIKNKTIVVTGAGGGIGSELVMGLLSRGARVAAVDLRETSLQVLKERTASYAEQLSFHALDITDKTQVEALPAAVIAAHGSVEGVINNAGMIQPFVRVNDLDYVAIERVMHVNFYGTLYMVKAFLPELLKRDEAYLVNVSSMGGFLPVPGQAVYGASKAAVKLLTEALYAELLDTSVHMSVVFPGATNTDISKNSHVSVPSTSNADTAKLASNMLAPDRAAELILKGMEKNKVQIFTGKDSKLMNCLYRLNPVFAIKFIAKQMKALLN